MLVASPTAVADVPDSPGISVRAKLRRRLRYLRKERELLLRDLGGFPPDLRWHGDLLAAYVAAFESGAVYAPGAVSYVRLSPVSYGASGRRSNAQLDVLRAWHATTKRPGWERRRAALVAAAILPEYSLRALRVLLSDLGYVTPRLVARLAWLATWTRLAPFVGTDVRRRPPRYP